jgi:hypothetical protein
MKIITLSTSLLFITSLAIAQNKTNRNVNTIAQSNINDNVILSNGYSNVSNVSFNQSNVQSRNVTNVLVADNNVNYVQGFNNLNVNRPNNNQNRNRSREEEITRSEERNNIQANNNPISIQSRGNLGNINYVEQSRNVALDNVYENNEVIDVKQSYVVHANDDVSNVVLNVQTKEVEETVNVKESNDNNFQLNLNVDVAIDLPKPNVTLNLKVKEVKEEKETVVKEVKLTSSKGSGASKVKVKSRSTSKRKSHHYYRQNVKVKTILKNSIAKLKKKVKKSKTKKPVFSVVCYKF